MCGGTPITVYQYNENGEVEEVLLDDSELTISGFSSTLFKIRFFYSKINVSGTFLIKLFSKLT